MVVLADRKRFRDIQSLPFCYLCGKALAQPTNRDHVPPSSIFLTEDRDYPLILPTHVACNSGRADEDRLVGGLVGVLHGKAPDPRHHKLNPRIGTFEDGTKGIAVGGFNFRSIIRRWVRGFHAALYEEFIADEDGRFLTTHPMPEGDPETGHFDQVQQVIPAFVETLKKNRLTGSLDRIVCRNGTCVYECVWVQADDGRWLCVYALDLYGWIELGDIEHFEPRGCVGAYLRLKPGHPQNASVGTKLVFDVPNTRPLDPFGP